VCVNTSLSVTSVSSVRRVSTADIDLCVSHISTDVCPQLAHLSERWSGRQREAAAASGGADGWLLPTASDNQDDVEEATTVKSVLTKSGHGRAIVEVRPSVRQETGDDGGVGG
jgi:hypothetical protein